MIETAAGAHLTVLVTQLDAASAALGALAAMLTDEFERHLDAKIISGARLLAELGDDKTRFTDDRAPKAYTRAAPVARASGKARLALHRRAKNKRAAAVGYT